MGGHAKAFLGWSVALLAVLAIVLFAHYSTVHVAVTPEPIQIQLPATLDTSITKSLLNLGILAASVGEACVDGALTVQAENVVLCAVAEDTKQLATTAIVASLADDRVLLVDSLSTRLEIAASDEADEHRSAVLVFASAAAVPVVQISRDNYYALRNSEPDLRAYFEGKPGVKNVEISYFPAFFRFLPFRYQNLRIILDIQ